MKRSQVWLLMAVSATGFTGCTSPRAALPPRAKAGDRDFIGTCPCGYSRPVSKSEQDKKPRCSNCGKVMTVTIARTEKHKSKPSAPLIPLFMRPKAALLQPAPHRESVGSR